MKNINKFENASISNNETHAIKGGVGQQATSQPSSGGLFGSLFGGTSTTGSISIFTGIGQALDGILSGILGIFGLGGGSSTPSVQPPAQLYPQYQGQVPQFLSKQQAKPQQQIKTQQQGRVQQIKVQQQVRRQ